MAQMSHLWVGKIPWRRAWQSTPVFLPGEYPWTEEPGRLQSKRSQRVRHDWVIKHTHGDLHRNTCVHTHTHTQTQFLNKWGNTIFCSWLNDPILWGASQVVLVVKEPACQCRRLKRHQFDPWVGKISWKRKWQPTPVFLPGESHGQKILAGYSPQGHKALDMTEAT